jgi:amidase
MGVSGPMARTVADAALLLSVMAGPDARSPIALSDPGETFAHSLDRDFRGVHIAWSRDLGSLPFEREVLEAFDAQRSVFESLGCIVEDATPDFSGADEAFVTQRHLAFFSLHSLLTDEQRALLKPELRWQYEEGARLTTAQIAKAERLRTVFFQRMSEFMARHEFLVCPVSQVLPFDVEQHWVTDIVGVNMGSYLDWVKSCCRISVTSCPAISVPAGFSNGGLPVGIQIVGRHHDDFGVLQLAHAFEAASGEVWRRRPATA